MISPRQKICKLIGEAGCYFLSIIHIAEMLTKERIDAVDIYEAATYTGVMEPDCFVNKPGQLLGMMVPGKWGVASFGTAYKPGEGEYEITRYERTTVVGVLSHFVCTDGDGHVVYDPLGDSLCVKLGRPVSKRIFRKAT